MKKRLVLKKEIKEELQEELISLLGMIAIGLWWYLILMVA